MQLIVRDATREEEVRQQLERAARELERLNLMKNSFLGLASHELKTPLTIILGYVELLLNEMSERLDDGTREMLRHIGRASDRLAEIVRDMVDVSMLDNRTLELMSQEISANNLVGNAVEKSQDAVRQRRQKLHLELADELPSVRCDQERMTQAISNILGNAIKFTPDYGLIRIRTRLVMRPRLPEKFATEGIDGVCAVDNSLYPYVEIAVIDSGIGVAKHEQETIFDKFYEVGDVEEHSSGKVAFKSRGAGLGLTIVKGVVDMHGGAVWVESPGYDPERFPGSTFYILLPAIPPSAADSLA
ncbi:MAG: HAMP domain-containing histidine kinase [Desulfuromonas sp.]|nr:HAMP domain-containing histidine kinase [Desulfuromonas sp.]